MSLEIKIPSDRSGYMSKPINEIFAILRRMVPKDSATIRYEGRQDGIIPHIRGIQNIPGSLPDTGSWDWKWSGRKSIKIGAGSVRLHYWENGTSNPYSSSVFDVAETEVTLPDSTVAQTVVVQQVVTVNTGGSGTINSADFGAVVTNPSNDGTSIMYFPLYNFSTQGALSGSDAVYVLSRRRRYGDIDLFAPYQNPSFGTPYSGTVSILNANTLVVTHGVITGTT